MIKTLGKLYWEIEEKLITGYMLEEIITGKRPTPELEAILAKRDALVALETKCDSPEE